MRDKVVVIGSLNYDIILKSSRLPERGETMPVDNVSCSAGGKGANQAVQAAKLGVHTYMVGCVGNDSHGDYLLKTARNHGLDTTYVRRTEVPTGMGVVSALDDGSVYASIARGANFAMSREDVDAAEPVLREAAIVILQMEIPQEINEYAIQKAHALGCRILMNAAPAAEIDDASLQLCDLLVVNEVEAAFYLKHEISSVELAKSGVAELAAKYNCDVILTLGKSGAVVSDQGEISYIPSREVDAIETTGAGDSFIGGVSYGLMQGLSLTRACEFATCCSSVTVCRMGAQDSMPTLQEVAGML